MPKRKLSIPLLLAVVLAVVAIGILLIANLSPAVEIKETKEKSTFVDDLEVRENPDCRQDHFLLWGVTSRQAPEQSITVERLDSKGNPTGELMSTDVLSADTEFRLPSPQVPEEEDSKFRVLSNRDNVVTVIAIADVKASCVPEG